MAVNRLTAIFFRLETTGIEVKLNALATKMPFWTVHILALQNTKLPDLLVANLHYRNWSKRSTFRRSLIPPHVLFYLISLQACWEPLTASWARILSTSTWSSPSPPSPPHKTSSSSMEYVTELVSEGSPLAWLTSSSRVETQMLKRKRQEYTVNLNRYVNCKRHGRDYSCCIMNLAFRN